MKIKIIWDFKALDHLKVAEGHPENLTYFCEKQNVENHGIGFESLSEFHSIAYVVVEKPNVNIIRDSLKPHRAEVVEQ